MAITTKGRYQAPSRQVDPPTQHLSVTPSDDVDLTWLPRRIKVGVGGLVRLWLDGDSTTNASGQIIFGSISGTVGAVISGTTVTVSAASYATATLAASALVVAINADPTVSLLGTASNTYIASDSTATATATVTFTYKNPAPAGDAITLAASGTGVTVSGATLSGSDGTYLEYFLTGIDYERVIRRVLDEGTTAENIRVFR